MRRILCQPLTRRLMLGGIPSTAAVGLFALGMELVLWRLYLLLPLLGVLFVALRQLYARDEWGPTLLLDHLRAVLYQRTRMEP